MPLPIHHVLVKRPPFQILSRCQIWKRLQRGPGWDLLLGPSHMWYQIRLCSLWPSLRMTTWEHASKVGLTWSTNIEFLIVTVRPDKLNEPSTTRCPEPSYHPKQLFLAPAWLPISEVFLFSPSGGKSRATRPDLCN